MQSIGILGGSFDPVHNGHLHIATQVQRLTHMEEIRFIPCKIPLLKPATQAATDDRFEMLNLAIAHHTTWYADDREIIRETPSYMIETLMSLRAEYPTTSLNLILGWDAFQDIFRWHQWAELIDYANFVVVNRAEVEATLDEELAAYVNRFLIDNPAAIVDHPFGKIALLSCTELPISSRSIREKIHNGEEFKSLVPEKVYQYIQDHHVYLNSHY